MKTVLSLIMVLTGFLFQSIACAQDDPAVLVSNTSEQVRVALMKENGSNTADIRQEVETMLFPRFDFTRMTALAVGKYWRQATPQQKEALAAEFKTLLSNTYFNTMLRYRDAKIVIKKDIQLDDEGKQATVKSDVMVANAQDSVSINYVLYNTDEGWKVFNINVEGASLVTVYRNQFNDEISKSGIDGLVQSLHTKNLANGAPATSVTPTPAKN